MRCYREKVLYFSCEAKSFLICLCLKKTNNNKKIAELCISPAIIFIFLYLYLICLSENNGNSIVILEHISLDKHTVKPFAVENYFLNAAFNMVRVLNVD